MENKCFCDKPGHCLWHDAATSPETFQACVNGTPPTPTGDACLHLGAVTDQQRRRVTLPIYECRMHGLCTLAPSRGGLPNCHDCKHRVRLEDGDLRAKWVDPLFVTDRSGIPTTTLRNYLAGGSAFLVCGGPSLNQLPFQRLSERGIFSLGVNNVAGYVPTSAFVCSDPPSKFHSSIFLDPKVMKFLPTPKLRGNRATLRRKVGPDTFEIYKPRTTAMCPNTWGFERRSWLMPDHTWFTSTGAAWGNHEAGVHKTGQPKTVNTMLLGLRLLQYLGARRIFLLGVDFHMAEQAAPKDNYSFGELRDDGAIRSNNAQYAVTNNWLCQLRPVFEHFGFFAYNCNPASHLRAFEYVPFDAALKACRGDVEVEPYDLEGWYKK